MTDPQATAAPDATSADSGASPGKNRWVRGVLLAPMGVIPGLFWWWLLGPLVGLMMIPVFVGYCCWENARPSRGTSGGLWWRVPGSIIGIISMIAVVIAATDDKPVAARDQAPPSSTGSTTQVRPTPAKKPETIEDKVGAQNVERAGDRILVNFHTGTVWSEKWVVIRAGNQLETLGRWAAQDLGTRLPEKYLVLRVHTPTVDQYGKEGSRIVMMLEVATADFGKIDWSNFSGDMMLNLTKINLAYPVAASSLAAYCQDKGREMFARQFCREAARFMR